VWKERLKIISFLDLILLTWLVVKGRSRQELKVIDLRRVAISTSPYLF
jgi:hypothetical protein